MVHEKEKEAAAKTQDAIVSAMQMFVSNLITASKQASAEVDALVAEKSEHENLQKANLTGGIFSLFDSWKKQIIGAIIPPPAFDAAIHNHGPTVVEFIDLDICLPDNVTNDTEESEDIHLEWIQCKLGAGSESLVVIIFPTEPDRAA